MKKLISFLLICALLSYLSAYAADTSIFFNGGVLSVDQPNIKIIRIYGLNLTPLNQIITTSDKEIFFPHRIENLGNTTNTISLEVLYVSQAKGWSAELIKDGNGNGQKDWWEGDRAESNVQLGEGSVYHFFLKLTRPENVSPGDSGSAKFKASCLGNGGGNYTGYNGLKYGGPDNIESTDTVMIK